MPTAPSDESVHLFTLLSDGRWHRYLDIKAAIAVKVGPGKALRAYEARLNGMRKMRGDPDYDTSASEQDRIELGALEVAQATVSSWAGRGLESNGLKGKHKLIRVKPGFNSWGLPAPSAPPEGDEYAPGVGTGTPGDSGPPETPSAPLPLGVVPLSPQDAEQLRREEAEEERAKDRGQPLTAVSAKADQGPEPVVGDVPHSSTAGEVYWWQASEPPSLSVIAEAVKAGLPSCPECGLLVGDFDIHKLWHARQEQQNTASGAVLPQKNFEDLLDRFQVAMQTWMLLQFAQLEAKVVGRKSNPARWREGNSNRQHRQS